MWWRQGVPCCLVLNFTIDNGVCCNGMSTGSIGIIRFPYLRDTNIYTSVSISIGIYWLYRLINSKHDID